MTVIIPTFNRPEQLGRELECLALQKGGHLREVIVCDDGSSTDTRSVVARFHGELPGLKLLRQQDLGFRAGQARNMGIREARGDLLLFIDDDLLLPPGFVSVHAQAHKVGTRRVVLGYRFRAKEPPQIIPPALEAVLSFGSDDREARIGKQGGNLTGGPHPWYYVYSCNFSVPNDPDHVHFDESFVGWGMEDLELGYRLVMSGFEVVMRPQASVLHLESPRPRDPFVCEDRGMQPTYDSYVCNMVQFIDKYPGDLELWNVLATDLRWYVRDGSGRHWVKNGFENDIQTVLDGVRGDRCGRGAASPIGAGPLDGSTGGAGQRGSMDRQCRCADARDPSPSEPGNP